MIDDHDIRKKIALVANNDISLNDFENWFVQQSRNMHLDSSSEAIDLAESIHLLLSERDDRIFDEAGFRDALLSLQSSITHVSVHIGAQSMVWTFSSISPALRWIPAQWIPVQL